MYSDYPEIEDVAKKTKNLCSKIENEEIRNDIKQLVASIVVLIAKERNIARQKQFADMSMSDIKQVIKNVDSRGISFREVQEGFFI